MVFDYQPTLRGELVEPRPLRAGDFTDLYAVAADPSSRSRRAWTRRAFRTSAGSTRLPGAARTPPESPRSSQRAESLKINDAAPAVGRTAITAAAQDFMTAFPDMVVAMDRVGVEGDLVVYRWTLTGTNTGPGGTGKAVRLSGYEEWTIGRTD